MGVWILIPAKADFMQVTGQMLFTQIMKHTLFCPFKHCVKRFGGIVVGITTRIFFALMVYPLMRSILFADQFIGMQFVGFKMRTFINKPINHWRQIGNTVILNRSRPHRAITFNGNKHSLFGGAFAPFVHNAFLIPGFAANIFFVQFNNAAKRWHKFRSRVHHLSDGMTQFPGTFLRNTDQFTQINRRYAFARIDNQIHGQQPFPQGQLGTVHGRFGCNGKLTFAPAAFVNPFSHTCAR